MHVLVLRHCAREVWQRYLWGTGVQPGLGEQSVRSEVVSTALRSLIKVQGSAQNPAFASVLCSCECTVLVQGGSNRVHS